MQSTTLIAFVVLSLFQVTVAQPQLVDIVQTAVADGRFTTLATALTAADLVAALKSPGPFTVFAPTDDAFAKLPPGTIDNLLKPENKPLLIKILTYHVVAGQPLKAADILAFNPPYELQMLNNLSTQINVDENKLVVDDAIVIQADVLATNGIIHAIDTVLLPPDVVDIAVTDGRFKTLVVALTAADLVAALKGPGPFTVFAPTDAAFAKLPPGTLNDLLKPQNKPKLIEILSYHVVAGRTLAAADILALNPPFKLEMSNGLSTQITEYVGDIKINDATVIVANVFGTNGVIHAIDRVLLPAD
jgi:transforming growth factor-beta-induced protein